MDMDNLYHKRRKAKDLFIVGGLIFLLVAFVALALAVIFLDDTAIYLQERLGRIEKYNVLKTTGFCIVGVLLVWQAWAANKRAKAMEDATENTEAGQRQERLKNAIEHLGHKRDSVRIGSAYELFHLAKDTRDLRQTVMDILCSHIRQTTRGKDYLVDHETKPSEEIQGLVTLLFEQEYDVFEGCSINLQGSYLNGATLIQARLKYANLREVQLQGANLMGAQLQKADLWGAQLQKADLWGAQLQKASLRHAQLQKADLSNTQLKRADFSGAQLQGANLFNAHLQEADLMEAQLQGAVLGNAQLQEANLMEARLQGADLSQAQLQGVNLSKAQLQGVSSPADYLRDFESNIRNRIGKDSDLTGIIFAGGLQEKDLEALCEGLSDYQAQTLRKKLTPHVGQPASHELPSDSGAVIGAYTQKEAKQWIAEYNKAMEGAPR